MEAFSCPELKPNKVACKTVDLIHFFIKHSLFFLTLDLLFDLK